MRLLFFTNMISSFNSDSFSVCILQYILHSPIHLSNVVRDFTDQQFSKYGPGILVLPLPRLFQGVCKVRTFHNNVITYFFKQYTVEFARGHVMCDIANMRIRLSSVNVKMQNHSIHFLKIVFFYKMLTCNCWVFF